MTVFNVNQDNIENYYQRDRVVFAIANTLIPKGFDGSIGGLVLSLTGQFGFRVEYDRRTKEGKEFVVAERELMAALARYDMARAACKTK